MCSGGSIVDQIIRGTTKEDFTARLKRAIDPSTPESDSSSGVSSVQTSVPSSAPTSQPERPSTVPHPTSSTQRASAGRAGGNDAVPTITPNVSATDTSTSSPPGRPQEDSYARQQVRRKQEAMQERDRVRSLIEADKQERKAREERRRAEALAQSAPPEQDRSEARTEKRATSAQCGIQVRLLDGSTIRQRFKAQDNLQSAVRSFVDSNRTDGTAPYTFKLVLTPHPSRAVNESEEKFSFEKLGLLPGVSLALIPVKNLAHAYQTGGSRGFIRSAPLLLYGYLVAVLAYINLTIRTLLGIAAGTDQRRGNEQMDNQRTTRSTQAKGDTVVPNGSEPDKPGMRIRTLNDQKDRADDKQFYNGNQVSTQAS